MLESARTYQFRLHLTAAGHQRLDEVLRQCCNLWNDALECRRAAYRTLGVDVRERTARPAPNRDDHPRWPPLDLLDGDDSNLSLSNLLTEMRQSDPRMEQVARRVHIGVLARLDRAYQAFFDRVKRKENPGFPRFKSSRRFRTLEVHSGYERYLITDTEKGKGWIRIKGLPRMEFRLCRELPPGQPQCIRITRKPRHVVLSLVYKVTDPEPEGGQPQNPVGIDLGVKKRIALSDGEYIDGRKTDRRRLRRLQRKAPRTHRPGCAGPRNGKSRSTAERRQCALNCKSNSKHQRSASHHKKVKSISKEWQRITDADRGAQHELTTALVQKHDFIAAESLLIRNMIRSAKGTAENPGKNVRQKAGLNRGISEQGWGGIQAKIAYKAASAGKRFVLVNPAYTSQTCSQCGVVDKQSRKSQALFHCRHCGFTANADVNGARNVLYRGLLASDSAGTYVEACYKSLFQSEPADLVTDLSAGRMHAENRERYGQLALPGFG